MLAQLARLSAPARRANTARLVAGDKKRRNSCGGQETAGGTRTKFEALSLYSPHFFQAAQIPANARALSLQL